MFTIDAYAIPGNDGEVNIRRESVVYKIDRYISTMQVTPAASNVVPQDHTAMLHG
jgi:hypothetical protein